MQIRNWIIKHLSILQLNSLLLSTNSFKKNTDTNTHIEYILILEISSTFSSSQSPFISIHVVSILQSLSEIASLILLFMYYLLPISSFFWKHPVQIFVWNVFFFHMLYMTISDMFLSFRLSIVSFVLVFIINIKSPSFIIYKKNNNKEV